MLHATMPHNITPEEILSVQYVLNFADAADNLPLEIQLSLSSINEIDIEHRAVLKNIEDCAKSYRTLEGADQTERKNRLTQRLNGYLIRARELGDDKLSQLNTIQDIIDIKLRQLKLNKQSLDIKDEDDYADIGSQSAKLLRGHSPSARESPSAGVAAGSSSGAGRAAQWQYANESYTGVISSTSALTERSVNLHNRTSSSSPMRVISEHQQRLVGAGGGKRSRRRNESVTISVAGDVALSDNNDSEKMFSERPSVAQRSAAGASCGASGNNSGHKKSMQSSSNIGAGASNSAGLASSNNRKKKRKTRGAHGGGGNDDPNQMEIDPDEPTYCVCNQISYGEMVLCDNDLCPIKWFHFSCVALNAKPKGKWYCPHCRGERANVMKPKAVFLKELERYNKEKEETL